MKRVRRTIPPGYAYAAALPVLGGCKFTARFLNRQKDNLIADALYRKLKTGSFAPPQLRVGAQGSLGLGPLSLGGKIGLGAGGYPGEGETAYKGVEVVDGRTVRRADRLTAVVDPLNKVTPWLVDRYPAIGRTNADIRAAVKDCRSSGYWCDEANAAQCNTNTTSGLISTTDSRLCSNPEVWRNVSCNSHFSDGRVYSYGSRCTSNMACAYPWYTNYGNMVLPNQKCSDRSDEIFEEGLTCRQHRQKEIKFHQEKFCNVNYPGVQYKPICINKTQWLLENPSKSDPHNCQSSCANSSSGLDCVACSNSSYFSCFKSGHCVPPALVCDGHPQCPNGEDENLDLDNCHKKYIENKIVEPYASYRCESRFYGGMEIFGTPCNSIRECADGSGKSL